MKRSKDWRSRFVNIDDNKEMWLTYVHCSGFLIKLKVLIENRFCHTFIAQLSTSAQIYSHGHRGPIPSLTRKLYMIYR